MLRVAPESFPMTDFALGMNWSDPPNQLDPRESLELKNFNIIRKGLEKRGGMDKKYPTTAGASTDIHSLYEYKAPSGTDYIMVGIGTTVQSYYGATWNSLKTGLTSGSKNSFATHRGLLFSANSDDNTWKMWNVTTSSLGLTNPTTKATSAYQAADSEGVSGKYRYRYTYIRDRDAISFYCDASDATAATAKKVGDTLTIVVTGGTSAGTTALDLTAAANDTLTELDTVLEAVAGIASQLWNTAGDDSSDIYDFGETDILSEDNEKFMEYETLPFLESNPSKKSDEYEMGRTVTDDNEYTGDGSDTTFSSTITLTNESFLKGTVEFSYIINGQQYFAADDEEGAFDGEHLTSGTVDYDSGAISLVFRTAPDDATEINFNYQTAVTQRVTVTGTADTTINKIRIYRTLDLEGEGADSEIFFKLGDVANPGATTATYDDSTYSDDLTTIMSVNNTKPPLRSKFLKLHKDRMFYVNNPLEADGDSLAIFSKSAIPESCPSSNYQYFDRQDGEEITGCASFGDYFVLFKRNKIAVIEGDFEALYYISVGVGCIAPWAIIEFRDKVIFLSEEGWMSFDGQSLLNVSDKVNTLIKRGYLTVDKNLDAIGKTAYSSAYYPEKHQIQFLLNTDSLDDIVMCGHFIENIIAPGVTVDVTKERDVIGWTYHEYDSDTLTCLGTYTDSVGNMKLMAGASDGFVYNLDEGTDDDGSNIQFKYMSGWSTLGTPETLVKTLRAVNVSYGSTAALTSHTFYVDVDFETAKDSWSIEGGSVLGTAQHPGDIFSGTYQLFSENYRANATGQHIRYRWAGNSTVGVILSGITSQYRVTPGGIRFWTPTRSSGT